MRIRRDQGGAGSGRILEALQEGEHLGPGYQTVRAVLGRRAAGCRS